MQGSWRQKYLRYKTYLLNTVDRYEERADIRVYLEILLSLITISIFSIFALRPTLLTIAELIKEIEAKEELVQRLENKIDTVNQAQVLANREEDNIELLRKSITQEAQVDILIYQLEGLVEKNQVIPLNLSINESLLSGQSQNNNNQQGTDEGSSDFIKFSINIRGDYVSLFSFVSDFEKLLRPIRITSTSINTVEEKETEEVYLTLTLVGEVPYLNTTKPDQLNQ